MSTTPNGAFVLENKDIEPSQKRPRINEELPPAKKQKPNISTIKELNEKKRILEQKLQQVNESLAKINEAIEQTTAAKAAEIRAAEAKPVVEPPVTRPSPAKKNTKAKPKAADKKKTTNKPDSVSRPKRQRKKSTVLKEAEESVPLSSALESCKAVITAVLNHRFGFPFAEPVDPVLLNIPDYFDIIKHPMDFGTIRKKLYAGKYEDISDFSADANLVFSNACMYNHPGTDVYIMAESLREFFEKKMKTIEEREKRNKSKDGGIQDLKKSVNTIQTELHQLIGTNGSRGADKSKIPMTKSEMRKLSGTINSLPYKHLNTIIKIIQESMPNLAGEGELEIDLNSLDNSTLRKLEAFVATVKKKKPRKKISGGVAPPSVPAQTPNTTNPPAPAAPVQKPHEEETVRVDDSSSSDDSSSDSESSSSESESDTESEAEEKPKPSV